MSAARPTVWDDPLEALALWLAEATGTEPRVPDAMQLATVSASGRPSIRTVLLKDHGPEGLVFYTNFESRKAQELDEVPRAAVCLHWKTLERQILAEGPVERVEDAVADGYFASRARGSQVGAWASPQSRTLRDRAQLQAAVEAQAARFADQPVPRPPFWGGYRLRPERIELWQGQPDRLHDRWCYTRTATGWSRERLAP